MVLNHFKSYAGLVGPNGSGKSNVIDALLFVFGYRANKMRQGKLSDLIHSSSKYPNCESCSVEIHFQEIIDGDGPGDMIPVPNSRLVVSRQAMRNSSSKYFINKRTSSFSEVTTLLRARGIDLDHKRFLILQGEVESIALMKPKAKDEHDDGLLEYLEDIIGTSQYKDAIEAIADKLELVNEGRVEKLNRVKFVAKEKDSLEESKAEAEQFLENENELARKKNDLYQIYLYESKLNMEVAEKAVEDLKIKVQEESEKHVEIEKEVKEIDSAYQENMKEYEALGKELENAVRHHAKFEKEEVQLREQRDHLVTKQEKLKTTIQADRDARVAAKEAIKKHTAELLKRNKELKELVKQKKIEEKTLDDINEELSSRTKEYSTEIEERKKTLAPWTERIDEKRKSINIKKSEAEILAEKISSGEKAVLGTNETECREKLSLARQKADEAKGSMQQSRNRGNVINSLLRMRDSGRIKGIHGRLGNLGVIDDKYDIAISTACPALDNIVVDTVEAGQACISYLRENNVGRANFTILQKLRDQDLRPIRTPEDVPRLFDLIQPKEEKFAPAFYSIMADTLVVKDLTQANRIAYGHKRWRVVTLDGKLIEKSGVMTGGGNRPQRGAMGSRFKGDEVSAETVALLEKERNQLEVDLRQIMDERHGYEMELRSKKDTLPRKEMSLEKLEMDKRSLDKQIKDEEAHLVNLNTQTKPRPADVKRLKDIEEEVQTLEQDITTLKDKTADIEEKIRSLHEDIMEAGGMELRLQNIVVNDMTNGIKALDEKITKSTYAKSKAEKDVTRLEFTIQKTEADAEKIDSDLQDLEKELTRMTKEAAEASQQVESSRKVMEDKKEKYIEIKNGLDAKMAEINKLRESKVNTQNKLDEYQRSLIENKRKAEHWKEQRSKLTLHKINEESLEELELPTVDEEEVKELRRAKQVIKGDIAEIEALVQDAKPNLSVLEEYKRRDTEYKERLQDLNSVTEQRDMLKIELETLRKKRLDEFMHGFNIISQKLKEMYQMITLGGNAELELVDSLDPFSEGIVFSVMPPKKSWKNISNLSGGEKVN
ncbi:hypothetical protein J3Q64DRAFT_1631009 [Phycomyces blakesleeanus]|uniref:SMC hinge domain-containing protein n=1 Tax=Phycomyces blakesleeanus TaxID=4837 RepID=A0ABR3BD90_PHYBL